MTAIPNIVNVAEILEYVGMADTVDEADQALINMIHPMVETLVRNHVQSNITFHQYTHFLPHADGVYERDRFVSHASAARFGRLDSQRFSHVLILPQKFVRRIVSLNEDIQAYAGTSTNPAAWGDNTLLTEGIHFHGDWDQDGYSESGILVRVSAGWPTKARSVRVIYEAGFRESELDGNTTNVEFDVRPIKLATLMTIASEFYHARRQRPRMHAGGSVVSEKIGDYSVTYGREDRVVVIPPKAEQMLEPYCRKSTLVY